MIKETDAASRAALALLALLALLVALPSSPVSGGRAQGGGSAKPSAVVFAVESSGGDVTIDPILGLGPRGRVVEAGGESGDDSVLRRFAADYFKAGRKYRLIFGGGASGVVTVKSAKADAECFRTGASVEAETAARLGGNVMALATDSQAHGQRPPSRRAPTAGERAGAEKLARTLLARRRLTPAQLGKLQTINLTATDLDGDGAHELAGTFKVVRKPGEAEQLFLLAEPQGASFRAAVANYPGVKAADLPDPALFDEAGPGGFLSEIFLDQLDLDGDGTGELFTFGRSLEGVQYRIYKRTAGRWRRLKEFYVYRCAY